jgi:hypothetical protein
MMLEVLPPLRSRKVLDHARDQQCTLRFKVCNGDPATTVSCHIPDRHKGMGQKSSDSSIVFGCSRCHVFLDERHWIGVMTEAEVLGVVIRAMQETLEILIRDDVIKWPHDRERPKRAKVTPPRKPPEKRAKLPSGRKLQSRNDLRRPR